jgi:photosystem II stability/assembly factor-like uncharacterized protein
VVLATLVVLIVAAAGFAYLRPTASRGAETASSKSSPIVSPSPVIYDTPNPVIYDFVTPSDGWAVENLDTPTKPAGGFAVFNTTDGARTWHRQLVLESSFVGYLQISVQFLDRNHGFIGVGDPFEQLDVTSDGGANWDSMRLPAASHRVDAIAFSSALDGWLLVGGQLPSLYATSDAANTWQRLPDPPEDAASLSFRNQSEAWLGTAGAPSPNPPHVYLSTDSGGSWHRVDLPPQQGSSWTSGSPFLPAGVDLLPTTGVIASIPAADQSGQISANSRLLTSFDRGSTWRYIPDPPGAVAFQDSTHWWAMKDSSLFKSADAGQSWATVTTGIPDWQYIPHVIDANHAWALTTIVGGYGLALTDDGGKHWRRCSVPQLP